MDFKYYCPWLWNSFYFGPESRIYPCCENNTFIGNTQDGSIKDWMNSPTLVQMRRELMQGVVPESCQSCFQKERATGRSLRTATITSNESIPKETASFRMDGVLEEFRIHHLDLRFSNQCNMACRFCSPEYSSFISQQTELLTGIKEQKPHLRRAHFSFDQLKEVCLDDLRYVHLAGGEPLIMPETFRLLQLLRDLKLFKTRIQITTNLSRYHDKADRIIEALEGFENVSISASIDGIENRFEYLRYGVPWNTVAKNLEALAETSKAKDPNSRLSARIHMSVYFLNVFTFVKDAKALFDQYRIPIEFNFSMSPDFSRLDYLPEEVKSFIVGFYQGGQEGGMGHLHYQVRQDKGVQKLLSFLRSSQIGEERSLQLLNEYLSYIRQLDSIRSQSFFKTFPEWKTALDFLLTKIRDDRVSQEIKWQLSMI